MPRREFFLSLLIYKFFNTNACISSCQQIHLDGTEKTAQAVKVCLWTTVQKYGTTPKILPSYLTVYISVSSFTSFGFFNRYKKNKQGTKTAFRVCPQDTNLQLCLLELNPKILLWGRRTSGRHDLWALCTTFQSALQSDVSGLFFQPQTSPTSLGKDHSGPETLCLSGREMFLLRQW